MHSSMRMPRFQVGLGPGQFCFDDDGIGRRGVEQLRRCHPESMRQPGERLAARTLAHFFDEETTIAVPIAGDDPSAKITVASVLEPLGFDVADAGPLSTSRWLEQLSELLACLASQDSSRDRIGFRLVRVPPPAPAGKPGTAG